MTLSSNRLLALTPLALTTLSARAYGYEPTTKKGAIVGIIICVVVLALLIGIAFYMSYRKKKQRAKDMEAAVPHPPPGAGVAPTNFYQPGPTYIHDPGNHAMPPPSYEPPAQGYLNQDKFDKTEGYTKA